MADEKKPRGLFGLVITARPQPGGGVATTIRKTGSNVVRVTPPKRPDSAVALHEREPKK